MKPTDGFHTFGFVSWFFLWGFKFWLLFLHFLLDFDNFLFLYIRFFGLILSLSRKLCDSSFHNLLVFGQLTLISRLLLFFKVLFDRFLSGFRFWLMLFWLTEVVSFLVTRFGTGKFWKPMSLWLFAFGLLSLYFLFFCFCVLFQKFLHSLGLFVNLTLLFVGVVIEWVLARMGWWLPIEFVEALWVRKELLPGFWPLQKRKAGEYKCETFLPIYLRIIINNNESSRAKEPNNFKIIII